MKHKIVIYKKIDSRVVDFLQERFEVVYFERLDNSSYPIFESHLNDTHILMGSGLKINEELLGKCPQLKVVSNVSVGYDNLDLSLLSERGIIATNTPEVLNETVADAIFGLMLATARRIPELDYYVKEGNWDRIIGEELFGVDVHGKVLGIVGLGSIGQAIAKRAHFGFDMKIVYHNRNRKEEVESLFNAEYHMLTELLQQSDYVISMLPLHTTTIDYFSKEEFSFMKKDAIFINGSRGGVLDENALYDALVNQEIAGAGLDVYKEEPIDGQNSLLTLDNIVTTPHIGSATKETRYKMAKLAADSLLKILSGEVPNNVLNKSMLTN